jgi:hypothetical protein
MMHIEQEKLNHVKKKYWSKAIFKVDSSTSAKTIIVGSLVKAMVLFVFEWHFLKLLLMVSM